MRSSGGTNFEILYGERDEEELSNEGLGGGEGKKDGSRDSFFDDIRPALSTNL